MDRRSQLLDTAEQACRAQGFDGFSYADLSAAVGIRKASIHHHFPTKADLAEAVIERYCEVFLRHLDAVASRNGTAGERLRAYVDSYRTALSGGESLCLCVAFSAGRTSLSDPVLKRLNAFHADSAVWLTAVFEAGRQDGSIRAVGAPNHEATACLALMEGAQLLARAACDVSLFDAATRSLLERTHRIDGAIPHVGGGHSSDADRRPTR